MQNLMSEDCNYSKKALERGNKQLGTQTDGCQEFLGFGHLFKKNAKISSLGILKKVISKL